MRKIFYIHLATLFLVSFAFANIRTVISKPDEIIKVNTSLGMSTLVYTPGPRLPSIIGDQSAFRVDMLSDFMSIKPLRAGARTNLFVMTEKRRFNLHLSTVNQGASDDVIYLREPTPEISTRWQLFEKSIKGKFLNLTILKVGLTQQGFFLIQARLTANRPMQVTPEQFWLLQSKESKVVQHLYISQTQISSKDSAFIGISTGKSDLLRKRPLILEYRGQETLALSIPEELIWK